MTGNRAVGQSSTGPDFLHHRGVNYLSLNELDLAIADFNAALRLDPGYDPARISRANANLAQGDENAALQDLNAVLHASDSRWLTYHYLARLGLGRVALRRKDYEKAITEFTAAAKQKRVHAATYAYRAEALLALGRTEDALADIDRALWVEPHYGPAYRTRSQIHAGRNRPLEAAEDAMRANLVDAFAETQRLLALGRDKTIPVDDTRVSFGAPSGGIRYGLTPLGPSEQCADDSRLVLWISLAAGMASSRPVFASTGGTITAQKNANGMTFLLGDNGCRFKVSIGKPTDGKPEQPEGQPVPLPRDAASTLEHRFYEPASACSMAVIVVRAFWGHVELIDETRLPPADHRWNTPAPPPGVATHRFGGKACEIEIRISKAD